jgi:hypothetical protein
VWAAATTWAVLGAAFLVLLFVSWLEGLTSSGLAGMQANEICAEAGLAYDADAARAESEGDTQLRNAWFFSYPCGETTDAVSAWVNPAIVASLIGAPTSWAIAGVTGLRNRRSAS